MVIDQIEGKMIATWNDEVKAVIDTWADYFITLEQFKQLIMEKAIPFAKERGGIAWIVDSSQAKGVFTPDIQEYIEKNVFQEFTKNGIQYFITTNSNVSALTNMNIRSYTAKAGPSGIQLLEVNSVADAIKLLKENAIQKAS